MAGTSRWTPTDAERRSPGDAKTERGRTTVNKNATDSFAKSCIQLVCFCVLRLVNLKGRCGDYLWALRQRRHESAENVRFHGSGGWNIRALPTRVNFLIIEIFCASRLCCCVTYDRKQINTDKNIWSFINFIQNLSSRVTKTFWKLNRKTIVGNRNNLA